MKRKSEFARARVWDRTDLEWLPQWKSWKRWKLLQLVWSKSEFARQILRIRGFLFGSLQWRWTVTEYVNLTWYWIGNNSIAKRESNIFVRQKLHTERIRSRMKFWTIEWNKRANSLKLEFGIELTWNNYHSESLGKDGNYYNWCGVTANSLNKSWG